MARQSIIDGLDGGRISSKVNFTTICEFADDELAENEESTC